MAAYQIVRRRGLFLGLHLAGRRGSASAARQWLGGLGTVAPLAGADRPPLDRRRHAFFVVLAATQVYGAVSGRDHVASAMLLTLDLVVGVLIFETLMQAFVRRLDSQLVGRTPASDAPKLPDVVARCVRVAVLIGVAVTIAESWVVEVFGLVERERVGRRSRVPRAPPASRCSWPSCCGSCSSTRPIRTWRARPRTPPTAIADGDAARPPASRISTMMPLLRMAIGDR